MNVKDVRIRTKSNSAMQLHNQIFTAANATEKSIENYNKITNPADFSSNIKYGNRGEVRAHTQLTPSTIRNMPT